MKKIFFTLSFSIAFSFLYAQFSKDQQQAIILKRMIERNHYSPRPVNDSFSSNVFSNFINALDPQQDIFTSEDYKNLAQYRYKIDDELNGKSWAFLDLTTTTYRHALKRAGSIITAILQNPVDLSADDSITFIREDVKDFPNTVVTLRNRWTKWFKFQMLDNIYEIYTSQSQKSSLKDVFVKNEVILRQKIKKVTLGGIQNILEDPAFPNYVRNIYFNTVAASFDPHTTFFSADEKEDFQASLSTENKSFGFVVDDKENKVIIQHLIPGGPAWKSGELHRNDQIMQLQVDGKEMIDVATLTAQEVEDLLDQTENNSITIKVRKANGILKTVALKKEKIETEENMVKGYILKGNKRVGYISLPDFYTTWEDEQGSGCANDVAKEIINLKKENIEGLILDVRFNGGGSLGEAMQLIGIFINDGPLLGVKEKNGKLVFLKDPNRGTIYDGPMVLMINGQSASASEVLAATLQDYHRAVIVGSTSYGKATMQAFFPMDTTFVSKTAPSPNGFVKITTGKLYRLNGETVQLNGVLPDVNLPDAFEALEYREKFSANFLQADSVKKNAYYTTLDALPVNGLLQASEMRIANHKDFNDIKKAVKLYAERRKSKKRTIPLKLDAFEKWMTGNKKIESDMLPGEGVESNLFTVINHKQDIQRMQNNTYSNEINRVIIKNLQEDKYLEEAFRILSDLIKLKPL